MTVKEEVETLITVAADPETDSMETNQGRKIEAKTVTRTPQGMTQDQWGTTNPRNHMTDQNPHTNLKTNVETALTTEALKGMAMTKEIGHTPETEEVPEDTADHITGTGRLGDLLDILAEEETDLEKEANLQREATGATATPEVAGTEATLEATGTTATPEVTGTAVTLETDPHPEEGETVGRSNSREAKHDYKPYPRKAFLDKASKEDIIDNNFVCLMCGSSEHRSPRCTVYRPQHSPLLHRCRKYALYHLSHHGQTFN